MEMARWQNINLTTIQNPVRDIVKASVELVDTMLAGQGSTPTVRKFTCKVVERGTLARQDP